MMLRTAFLISLPALALVTTAAPASATPGDPYALSDAILIDFTFTAPDGVAPQYFGGDVEDCFVVGDADCVLKDDQVNFGTMPKPDGYVYSIRHEYAVEASAPPPDFSAAFFRLTSFFHFYSANDDNVTLNVDWTVTYNLYTEGNHSEAGIAIDYSTKGPDNQGIPDTLLFAPDSVSDGGVSTKELDGSFSIMLYPGDTTLRIEDPVTAVASVPEPAAWAVMLVGLAGVGLAARARQRTSRAL